jgi:phosphosulfolactate synthase
LTDTLFNDDSLSLPWRPPKPRIYGLTSVIDSGTPLAQLKSILEDFHSYIDIAKLAMGSAYIMPNLRQKLALYRAYKIEPLFGGTLFEKFYQQGHLEHYRRFLNTYQMEWVEVSNGTLGLAHEEIATIVNALSTEFKVCAEVGDKSSDAQIDIHLWETCVTTLIEAGAIYVILEGRTSGTVGLYDAHGSLRDDLMCALLKRSTADRFIFEAPSAENQMQLIRRLGANVNLGNINPNQVLLLETQRCALRCETFFIPT